MALPMLSYKCLLFLHRPNTPPQTCIHQGVQQKGEGEEGQAFEGRVREYISLLTVFIKETIYVP